MKNSSFLIPRSLGRGSAPCWLVALAIALVWLLPAPAHAQARGTIVPDNWQGDALRPRPDLKGLDKLRFVTDSDYPPFHYYDEVGALTGFNVDLAKAICEVLEVQCEVSATNWNDLIPSLDKGEADAAIASIRITEEALKSADFTSRYYATPARFVARKETDIKDIRPETVEDLKIGVAKGTGHEAYLTKFFPDAAVAAFDNAQDAQKALKNGAIDLIFGDGITLTFWLNGVTSEACCEFRGGPYLDAKYFGEGVGIAVKKGNRKLAEILTYGLEQVHDSGRYEELFLRYFPMSFF
ncbi:MAG TPA: transporter substrate-binding domain-containing protein [Methyloceanibacter sp.]|nr:transporter substrate-binding domain-containing protein [Methyloceanibacter sp.]